MPKANPHPLSLDIQARFAALDQVNANLPKPRNAAACPTQGMALMSRSASHVLLLYPFTSWQTAVWHDSG